MKLIGLLFFTFFLISSCNPLDLDEKGDRRDLRDRRSDFKIDPAKGKENFTFPDLKDISGSEVIDKTKKGCENYKTSFVSILGKYSITKPLASCIAKAIDDGLAPLCEDEEKAEELLKYYEKERDEVGIAEVEDYLYELEDLKYETADEIYYMADQVYDQCEEWEEDMDDGIEDEDDDLQRFLRRAGKFITSSECSGLRRSIDHKARTVCKNFDFSKLDR